MEKSSQSKNDENKTYGMASIFHTIFEKTLGPKEQPKRKPKPRKTQFKKDIEPVVKYNPKGITQDTESNIDNIDHELIRHKKGILRINSNHFALNKTLERKEQISLQNLRLNQINSLIDLDNDEKFTKHKIVLEGGRLL